MWPSSPPPTATAPMSPSRPRQPPGRPPPAAPGHHVAGVQPLPGGRPHRRQPLPRLGRERPAARRGGRRHHGLLRPPVRGRGSPAARGPRLRLHPLGRALPLRPRLRRCPRSARRPHRPTRYRGLVFPGHDEYWSPQMRRTVELARENGTSLVFLSANTMYWQVELGPSPSGVPDRLLTCRKRRGPGKATLWREIDRPEQETIGIQYAGRVPEPHPSSSATPTTGCGGDRRRGARRTGRDGRRRGGPLLPARATARASGPHPPGPLSLPGQRGSAAAPGDIPVPGPVGRPGLRVRDLRMVARAGPPRPCGTPVSSRRQRTSWTASANGTESVPTRPADRPAPGIRENRANWREPRGGTVSGFVEKPEPVEVPGLVHLHTGKVRELYQNEAGDLVMVASDRTSAFDWVLPTEIPDKGRILTQLSLWWFDQLADLVPSHVLSTELPAGAPADWAGRTLVCKSLRMVPVECVARGYLTGSGLLEYNESRTVCGLALPGPGGRLGTARADLHPRHQGRGRRARRERLVRGGRPPGRCGDRGPAASGDPRRLRPCPGHRP